MLPQCGPPRDGAGCSESPGDRSREIRRQAAIKMQLVGILGQCHE
jgi:hypothetical protein